MQSALPFLRARFPRPPFRHSLGSFRPGDGRVPGAASNLDSVLELAFFGEIRTDLGV